jgi:hypothetical protein
MKIRCQVIDFVGLKPKDSVTTPKRKSKQNGKASEQPSSDMSNLHPLIQWTQIYFQSGSPPAVWDEAYVADGSDPLSREEDFIPPVYFQQDGHSRTLVGMNISLSFHALVFSLLPPSALSGYEYRGNGKCSLFIFDPNQHGTTFKVKLEERKGWQMMLKRGGHTLKRSEYQLVQVLPGLMVDGSQEYEDSKIMSSEKFP